MKRLFFVFYFILINVSVATAQQYPSYDSIYVNDFAGLIPDAQEERITQMLKDLRKEHDIEFTVVTIKNMSEFGHRGAIEPFATGLFNHWGVGNAARNDGVMMLVSRYDRQMRIEVGSGYGTSKNTPMKRIIDRTILPEFKKDRYGDGIEEGVRAVIADLTGAWPGEDTLFQKIKGAAERLIQFLGYALYGIAAGLAGLGAWFVRRYRRYRARNCPVDGDKMHLLAEDWDDKHLTPGQQKEEELASVDYDVWECPTCDHRSIEAYKAWFSRFGACRKCQYRTLEGDTTILESATTKSTGLKRIDYTCRNCDERYSVTKIIPKLSESSGGSSGGSSSFGGGSSSGGGASGRW